MQTRGVRGQKIPKNANVICERPLSNLRKNLEVISLSATDSKHAYLGYILG